MTAILDTPTTTETAPETVAEQPVAPAPVLQTFTIGTLTIEAHDEADALRQYKRMVRAEAMKAKSDQGWCDSGTNERLRILGLREVGAGVPMKVTVTATRTAYISVDAETPQEAQVLIGAKDPGVISQATATIGRGWTATAVEADGDLVCDPTKQRTIGDPDDTLAALDHHGVSYRGITHCSRSHNGYYCTMPSGHEGQHAAGNGTVIRDVWNNRLR